jgi:hypothetical protein
MNTILKIGLGIRVTGKFSPRCRVRGLDLSRGGSYVFQKLGGEFRQAGNHINVIKMQGNQGENGFFIFYFAKGRQRSQEIWVGCHGISGSGDHFLEVFLGGRAYCLCHMVIVYGHTYTPSKKAS